MYRPLVKTSRVLVEAGTHTGIPIPVKIYNHLGRKVFFLWLDGKPDIPLDPPYYSDDERYERWFAVDFSNLKKHMHQMDNAVHVSAVFPPKTSPYLHFNADKLYKRGLLDGLLDGEKWWVAHSNDRVVFSNEAIFVSVFNKKSQ